MAKDRVKLVCDAACRVAEAHLKGRDIRGEAAGGILVLKNGKILKEIGVYLGKMTVSEAEYNCLIKGLEAVSGFFSGELEVWMDSEFIVRQMNGQYFVKAANIKPLHFRVRELEKKFRRVEYFHHLRTEKLAAEADRLANEELDKAVKREA